jgi:histidine triad (HIT) family protein
MDSPSCLFCRIVRKEIPARLVFEDEHVVCFHDVNPQAPHHALVIPKIHLTSLLDLDATHAELFPALLLAAQRAARELGIVESGFRTVINTGTDGGQSVFHLHVHVLGGRPLGWPPG